MKPRPFKPIPLARFLSVSALSALLPFTAAAQGKKGGGQNLADDFPGLSNDAQPTPEQLAKLPAVHPPKAVEAMKDVKVPAGFTATIFATPPAVNYPVYVAASTDGTVYVSSDGNGSLDRKPHLGRVLRVRDTNGDGQADEVKAFVPDVDSPRGLIWDHDRLYLLHPPNISVYIDKDGDGVSDEEKVLIKGIAFTFKDRPADHSSNGIELGIDGWIYAAIGDFGFMEAEGTDGRKLQLRGGGVVRFRPDGTGLELFARGTRNILEVAVSPLLDAFARDNTNDGGGWDVRFHHFTGFGDHGYPRLYKNFAAEEITPLADYGGGAGCGAAWIDEPGIPAAWNNAPFTCDWGRNWVYRHGVTPSGATFTADQKEFLGLTRVTDLDVDGNSAIYAASWKGATFKWAGLDAGYLVKLTPIGYKPEPMPKMDALRNAELVSLLESPSARRRLEAQRTLLRRDRLEVNRLGIRTLASNGNKPLASRIAALFLLTQKFGKAEYPFVQKLASDPSIAAWALRALTDRADQMDGVKADVLTGSLRSTNARTRREALTSLARFHGLTGAWADGGTPVPQTLRTENLEAHASAIAALLTDPEQVIRHTAVQILRQMMTAGPAFKMLDASASADARAMALRVVSGIYDASAVTGLISRLDKTTDATKRAELLTALCRIHFKEGPWKGDSWGTRPDTRGPLYQPEAWAGTPRVAAALKAALDKADAGEAAVLASAFSRHRLPGDTAVARMLYLVKANPSLAPSVADLMANSDTIPAATVPVLTTVAADGQAPASSRVNAVTALAKSDSPDALQALLAALPGLVASKPEGVDLDKLTTTFLGSAAVEKNFQSVITAAGKMDGPSAVWADAALLRLSSRTVDRRQRAPGAALKAIDDGWKSDMRRAQILNASVIAKDASRAALIVAALDEANPAVAKAAADAVKALRIDPTKTRADASAKKIGELTLEDALAAVVRTPGDPVRGEQLFVQAGCVACHTVKADEPLKGPFLGNIASIYKRRELTEAVLLPNKTIAQGFTSHRFTLKNGDDMEGFVVQEAADIVTIRNVAAQELKLKISDIAKREKLDKSLMPEGLAAQLSVSELASLIAYLEKLNAAK